MSRRLPRACIAALACALLALATGCATAPATGESFFTGGLSEERERELGAEQHPKMLEAFGGAYEDEAVQAYVDSVGTLLAKTSEMPELDFTFTVLDSPMVNAFALPGGYVYVTRGLLALAGSEAELAGVLAHEIGHVTARHAAQRYGGQMLATAANLAAAILLGGPAAQATGGLAQIALAGYSRSQESEADRLGVRYLTRVGYEPQAMAGFLEKLQAHSRLEAELRGRPEAADRFSLLQTHPRTAERVREAIVEAGGKTVREPMTARDIYLDKIDGLLYGDDPEQGFVRGRRFLHPQLRFAFQVPEGFRLFNSPTRVVAFGPEDSLILFDQARREGGGDMVAYLTREWVRGRRLDGVEALTVDGMPAATGTTRLDTRQGPRDVRLVAIGFDDERVYRFLFVTPPALTDSLGPELRRTTYSFRRLSAAEAARLQPLRLRVHTVAAGETVQGLARRMPFADYRLERFRVLNGLAPGESLQPGERVKLVVE